MISRGLTIAVTFLALTGIASAQEVAKRQLIVPLAEGGFVAFKSQTSWADTRKSSTESQKGTSVLSSRAEADENRMIHRVLKDTSGRFIFGYDLWVAPNPAAKQFKIVVRPLDQHYESKLRAGNPSEGEPPQSEAIATFPKATDPQTLDDGDGFSLDLLVNRNTGVKIVDVVKVTFDRTNLWDINPRMMPRDFSLDAVELAMKDYRLLIDGNAIAASKSANGCAGALLWFYVQDRGRFIFSLVPRAGYEFQKVGVIEDNRIEFTIDGNTYEWLSSSPILAGGGTWNLWVLHDPAYAPIFGSDPGLPAKKSVWKKVDEVVNTGQNTNITIRNPRQTTLQGDTPNQATPSPPTIKRPRVMVGGADRIENLWPKGP
jgi:hypothetical protein